MSNELSQKYELKRQAYLKNKNDLKSDLYAEEEKLYELEKGSADKLAVRRTIEGKIAAQKKKGSTLRTIGIVCAVIAAILIFIISNDNLLPGIIVALVGIALIIIGCVVSSRAKQFNDEKRASDLALADFDKAAASINSAISRINSQIDDIDRDLRKLQLAELSESVSTGYVFLYATREIATYSDTPNEPKAKSYSSELLNFAQIQINDMVYATIKRKPGKGCLGFVHLDDLGTQKLQVGVQYVIGPENFDWVTAPTPFKPQSESVFVWIHVSTCMKGTKVFCNSYSDLESFLEATGISDIEILNLLK